MQILGLITLFFTIVNVSATVDGGFSELKTRNVREIIFRRASGSCEGRCGKRSYQSCQCNDQCKRYGDCCYDYKRVCEASGSCEGRCGKRSSQSCQCNEQCKRYGDCCNDYKQICEAHSKGKVTDNDLLNIGEKLWSEDVNRMPESEYRVNKYGSRFFTYVDESHFRKVETFKLYLSLLDNYNPKLGQKERSCSACNREEGHFLDAVLRTDVMQEAWKFLSSKGLAASTKEGFKDEMKQYWFGDYKRKSRGPFDSSGFEHVMVGEMDGTKVSGFHNWVHFYVAERDGELTFKKMNRDCRPDAIKVSFDWLGTTKTSGSVFLGSSPEMDMALYTICFLARPNEVCTVRLSGSKVKIQTYDIPRAGFHAVGSAYPIC